MIILHDETKFPRTQDYDAPIRCFVEDKKRKKKKEKKYKKINKIPEIIMKITMLVA